MPQQDEAMNSFNLCFKQKVENASKALAELNRLGCAILNMEVGEKGSIIQILPPRNPCLNAFQTCIRGDLNGRTYRMQARIFKTTVYWETSEQPKMGQPL